jgi:hypothetical protein
LYWSLFWICARRMKRASFGAQAALHQYRRTHLKNIPAPIE